MTKSIYAELLEAGIPLNSHESDLYALKNDISKSIVDKYQFKSNVTCFISQIDHKVWYDIPFAYDPYWINLGCFNY